ncbi:Uncharacterised protein [Chlamydia abortus]|uniref:hypothetical protein n=1 Tax=unclassified Paenibacillus TaxID=185978 RepID=UPI000A27DE9F|nr:hypothetical protein [Paenibacillus sp. 32O-W]SHE12711.1 Uncharacterised protein [Chlamydia abortus]
MYTTWAIFAGVVGLIVTGAAVFTVWHVYFAAQQDADRQGKPAPGHSLESRVSSYFLQWTVLDYVMLGLIVTGLLFLFVDLLAVMRNPGRFPYHHHAYLMVGFVFSFLGTLFMVVRLALTLQSIRPSATGEEHHDQPEQTDPAEQGIQNG